MLSIISKILKIFADVRVRLLTYTPIVKLLTDISKNNLEPGWLFYKLLLLRYKATNNKNNQKPDLLFYKLILLRYKATNNKIIIIIHFHKYL